MDAVKEAWLNRNEALKLLRIGRDIAGYVAVLQADEALVQAIAAKRNNPPNPLQNFTVGKIAYRLQSYKNGNARYVRAENFQPEKYEFEPVDMVQRVRDEISVRAKIEYELEILKNNLPDGLSL